MVRYRHIIVLTALILNIGSLMYTINSNTGLVYVFQDRNLPGLKSESFIMSDKSILTPISPFEQESLVDVNSINSQYRELNSGDHVPRFSIQQQYDVLLYETLDEQDTSFSYENKIWADLLGTDSYDSSLYENCLIDPYNTAGNGQGASLFTRIGNNGNDYGIKNESSAVEDLVEYRLSNISAGWQADFPIQNTYKMINISFKWRFDTPNGGFDDYDEFIYGDKVIVRDGTPDFQEIRCRIEHPMDSDKSFWVGNPISETNPNGTVFYRVGSNITQDEEWYTFKYSFQVNPESSNFTLELGAYLNTREFWNEYFDVWFDEIRIIGITDIPDNNPPQPLDMGLDRTNNISIFEFWANFSEGTWESSIKNVTVFYNQSGVEYNKTLNSSLNYLPPSYVTNAGYIQTKWQFFTPFNFSDEITFYFVTFDYANNSFVSEIQSTIIGDYSPPVIESTVINQTGTGLITISVNITDWGYGIDTLVLNYTIDGEIQDPISITGSGTDYQAIFTLNISQFYGKTVEFGISFNDTVAGNSDFYPGVRIVAVTDEVLPEIHMVTITPNSTVEERTHVTVRASDPFGEIDEVYLVVRYENGSIFEAYSHVLLKNTTTPGLYVLGKIAGVAALQLPFSEDYENYSITVVVRDKATPDPNEYSETYYYVVRDELAPKVRIENLEYSQPGLLQVRVQASDLGSGIESVILEKRTKDGWTNRINMTQEGNRYIAKIYTGWLGNEQIQFRVYAVDNEGNEINEENRPIGKYTTKIFFSTFLGLLIMEIIIVTAFVSVFTAIKVAQSQRLKALRRRRFEAALGRSERLAYLGEEAMFGFIAAYGQREGVSSILMWEPQLIGHFYQYLKELTDKANNNVAFIMQTRPQDQVTFVDFKIEEIGCSAITFAYPVSTLPQQWLSALTLDQVPVGGGQGILLLMLVMREKWGETANNFQEEIKDGIIELKDLICSGEDKDTILRKAQEFRLFISGTLEVLDEIEIETDEISEEIMGDFESEFLDFPDDDSDKDEADETDPSKSTSEND
ncbi:MAG: hypothetical protein ACFFB5_00140 [Promethearchaeota archaeon]